ncbi:MAG: tetratricopeptide repeat protein [Candidatus Eiseniibacteriota bacterium]|nr:MAG: tetratricopeptide repeat protein [Candidatus Eisenbacteria bacterium]
MSRGILTALFFAAFALSTSVSLSLPAGGQPIGATAGDPLSEEVLTSRAELRLNNGIPSLPPDAHAYYKLGIEERKLGNSSRAILAFRAASESDPYFLDPHFSLFRAFLFRDPGQAMAELSAAARIVRRDFVAQYFFLKNTAVMGWIALLMSVALLTASACLRHVTRLKHALSERLALQIPSRAAGVLAFLAILQPFLWGLGVAGTVLCYSGALWRCLSRRERFFAVTLLLLAVTTPFVSGAVASRFPPLDGGSPTLISYMALHRGWSDELERSLRESLEAAPEEAAYRFAYGTMARRAGKLGIARKELAAAVELSPEDAIYLNNLGNVYFNLGDLNSAEELYDKATRLRPSLPEPHYNLAQVFTKRMAFERANEELERANSIDSELISEFSMNSREQLNRSVIDASVSPRRFWRSLAHEGKDATSADVLMSASGYIGIGTPERSAIIVVLFAVCVVSGFMVFRNFYTYRCSNCGKVVCRKCLKRVHRTIFCEACGSTAGSLKSEEFAKLLFTKQLKAEARKTLPVSLPLRLLFPGFALAERGDSVRGFLLLLWTSVAAVYLWGQGYLFNYVPSLHYQQEYVLRYIVIVAPLLLLHVLVLAHISRQSASAPMSLRVLKAEADRKRVKDGIAGKPGRLQSG